jgi:methyltransferase
MILPPLVWVLALIIVQRLVELAIANRNSKRLLAEGWREVGADNYWLFIVLHVTWLAAIAFFTPLHRPPYWPLVGVLVLLQLGRAWVMASLGPLWTTRIITRDDAPLTRRGPFQFNRHPAYWIVTLEIAVLPLAFGDWAVAVIWSALNALLIRHRIKQEDEALAPRHAADLLPRA